MISVFMLQKRSDRLNEGRAADALYPRLLGVVWPEIDPALRRMHCNGEPVRATGLFRIRRGTSLWAKFLLLFLRLPQPSAAARVELVVRPEGQHEKWLRVFDGKPVVTIQREGPDGLLAERFGALEFQFRLRFANHTIHYEQVRVILRLAQPLLLEVPLPTWASPHVSARESAGGSEMETYVSVVATAPLGGLLFSYEGKMREQGI